MIAKLFDCLMVVFQMTIFQVSRLGMSISSSPDDCEKNNCYLLSSGDDEMRIFSLETENIELN